MRKNAKKLAEQMRRLREQMRAVENAYLIEVGKATLQWLQSSKNVTELENKISEIKSKFGKEN